MNLMTRARNWFFLVALLSGNLLVLIGPSGSQFCEASRWSRDCSMLGGMLVFFLVGWAARESFEDKKP